MKFLLDIFIFEIIFIAFVESHINYTQSNEQPFSRIIGGYRPQKAVYAKHIVSLRYGQDGKVYGSNHFCAGAIISVRVILTARHCVFDRIKRRLRERSFMTVVAGNAERLKKSETERTYHVGHIVTFGKLNQDTSAGDLALLYLTKNIEEDGETIERIPLTDEKPVPGMKCITLGWGKILYNGPAPDELVYLNLTVLPMEDCAKFIEISLGTMCAGDGFFAEKTAGSGDSGGPLICNGKVAGVSSFIIPIRTYFTSVWHYRKWITQNGSQRWTKRFQFLTFTAIVLFKIS